MSTDDPKDELPERSRFLDFLPRRNLTLALVLLVLLVAVVVLRSRAGSLTKSFGDFLWPAPRPAPGGAP